MGDNILFKKKSTGEYYTYTECGLWKLTEKADTEQAKDNIYEFINEIMEDHKCDDSDIELIYLDKYKENV